jgi:hypothetical protein
MSCVNITPFKEDRDVSQLPLVILRLGSEAEGAVKARIRSRPVGRTFERDGHSVWDCRRRVSLTLPVPKVPSDPDASVGAQGLDPQRVGTPVCPPQTNSMRNTRGRISHQNARSGDGLRI